MYRIDGKISQALELQYQSLSLDDKKEIDAAARSLVEMGATGLGRSTALEILYAIGRLMKRKDR